MNNPFYFQPDQWLVTMTTSLLSQSSWKPLRSIFKTLGLFLALQDLLIVLLVLYLISFIFLPQPLVKLKAPTSELPTPESPLPEHPICEIKDAATGGLDSEAFRAIGELETVWWGAGMVKG